MNREQVRRLEPTIQTPAPAPAPAQLVARPRQVRLIAGADVQDMDLAGRTVAEARAVAQAVYGIDAGARALVDGQAVDEATVLTAGQQLEFTKRAGQKGAGASGTVIEVIDDRASWRRGGKVLGDMTVKDLLARVGAAGQGTAGWRLYPRHVRLMVERDRGQATGVVVEMPPGPRQVSWIADDSPEPFGPGARYHDRYLSFPWVVLVLVFGNGELTGLQQAFYRSEPIASLDDELYFTNLLNVAKGHQQESWVCLVNLDRRLGRLGWPARIDAITAHFWQAAFNRSAEIHEQNSFWSSTRPLDRRVATAADWEAATRENPYFALEVRWKRAPRTVGQTLERMLDLVTPWRPIERVEHLVTLMQQGEE